MKVGDKIFCIKDYTYSWSLTSLIYDKIIVDLTKERTKKLKKLQNASKSNL